MAVVIRRAARSEEPERFAHHAERDGYSAANLVVFGIVGAVTVYATRLGWTQAYWKLSKSGWSWLVLNILVAIILHDTYFYWTHRLMTSRRARSG